MIYPGITQLCLQKRDSNSVHLYNKWEYKPPHRALHSTAHSTTTAKKNMNIYTFLKKNILFKNGGQNKYCDIAQVMPIYAY